MQWKILIYFMNIWSILRPLEIYSGRLVYFVIICYIFPRFGISNQVKSGNPAAHDWLTYRKRETAEEHERETTFGCL
jgi:hypothetical protein